jgi:hypothetical protein
VFDQDLLVRIVEVDGELGRENGLQGRYSTTIGTNRIGRQIRLCPFGNDGDFAVHDVWHVGIVEGDAVAVPRRGEVGVQITQVIRRLRLVSILTMVDCTLVGVL